jgi:uncharacterized zinc-type alcohol dehydrogenase-like protein
LVRRGPLSEYAFFHSFIYSLYFVLAPSSSIACNGDWGIDTFPFTPGHEIAGVVGAVGSSVTAFKVGDEVGVGCFVSSCKNCGECSADLEQHCLGQVSTYSTPWPAGKGDNYKECEGNMTSGGYSDKITVDEHFCFKVPESISLEVVGPLLCAGITTFSPLNRHILQKGGGKGKKVGVVGFGGLGHMAVKLAKAMGAEVTVLSRSTAKADKAKALGADIMVHSDPEVLKASARTFDVILDTVAESHTVADIVNTLKVGGNYVLLGGIPKPFDLVAFPMLLSRQSIEGSLVGGMAETQQMLDFCAKHGVVPECKTIHAKDASAHFISMGKGESGPIRAVIDISTIKDM